LTKIKGMISRLTVLNKEILKSESFECGIRFGWNKRRNLPQYRVVGGLNAAPGDFPWQVSLIKNGKHHCGGAIIAPKWVVTVAHCLKNLREKNNLKILAGTIDVQNEYRHGSIYNIEKFIVHENFIHKHYLNDIALIKLSSEIKINKGDDNGRGSVAPICLPVSNAIYRGNATISGWGALAWKGKRPRNLHAVDVQIIDDKYCRLSPKRIYDFDRHLCAGHLKGGKDACGGDSGSPLVTLINGKAVLIGLVAYGKKCAMPNAPGVYTEVAFFRKWIEWKTELSFPK
ncbi:trypsin-1-like protein, partial [Dinothrombium tinctorium]